MKIVFFGDSGSTYNKNVLNHLQNNGLECDFIDIFKELKNIKRRFGKIKYIKTIENFYLTKKILQKYKYNSDEDIAQINFVAFPIYWIFKYYYKKNFKKYILYFWGSDFYRQSKRNLKLMKSLYKDAANICFETPKITEDFHKIIPQFKEKDYCLRFGLPILDEIDNIDAEHINSFRKKFNIPSNKTIIVIGYNGRKEQQHINVVKNLKQNIIDSSFIIFPWTYGDCGREYEELLEQEIIERKINYVFIKQFLTDEEIAALRCITDILIQVQTTDAFSASMLETLYAGKKVITGKWLPYDILYENGVTMTTVNTPEEAGLVVNRIIDSPFTEEQCQRNMKAVTKLCKWDYCIEMWEKLYK